MRDRETTPEETLTRIDMICGFSSASVAEAQSMISTCFFLVVLNSRGWMLCLLLQIMQLS